VAAEVETRQADPIQAETHQQQDGPEHFYIGMTRYEYISAGIQGCMVLVTFCYVLIVGLQWSAMQKTLDITRESIALTKQTVRAWIITTKMERMSDLIANSPTTFQIRFKNVGSSMAFNVTFGVSVWTYKGQPSLSCASQCPPSLAPDPRAGETVLGPQEESFLDIAFPSLPQRALDAIKSGTQTGYFCGTIGYKDVFDTPHTLHICNYYIPDLDKFGICPIGNFET
jgi:hypothetical protein